MARSCVGERSMSVMAATIIAFIVTAAAASTSVSAFTSSFAPSSSSSSQNNKNGRVQDAKQCRRPLLLPFPKQSTLLSVRMQARQRRYPEEEDEDDGMYYDDEFDDEYDDYYDDEPEPPRRRRRLDDLGTVGSGAEMQVPSPFGLRSGLRLPDSVSKAVLAGIFVLGIGTGVTIDSQINTNPKDLASRDAIDQNAPNPIVCARYGASAMAFDQRVFVSFNPFNVYVAQADVKPACVLRQSNVVQVLQQSGLINENEVRSCKRNMNTWAFVGDIEDKPQLSCVYQSEDAQNEFLSNPKLGIGEDVYDDDRAMESIKKATGKLVKGGKKMIEEAPAS